MIRYITGFSIREACCCVVVVVCIALVFMIGFYLMLERFTGTVLNMCSIVASFVERIAQLNYGK
ncbi:hypothetical protein [Labilibaculum euxinus]|uniref:Uncharacterized protein n=1 Tax=Labilibaculum euxinus TaxID=2686357 RepID=A0A7M4D584_9BACT|nr:hypothetical protein [Labilibaculum euxinus]MUP37813.1 hypothetical protein [Labilibaculum euxinus]MVB07018.1 hypothetical protein [Labilibaculum euxinus]